MPSPNANAAIGGVGSLLALIGGVVAGSKHQQNALDQQQFNYNRDRVAKDAEALAKEGDSEGLKILEPAIKKYHPKEQLDVWNRVAETHTMAKRAENLKTLLSGLDQPGQAAPQPQPNAAPPGAGAMQAMT